MSQGFVISVVRRMCIYATHFVKCDAQRVRNERLACCSPVWFWMLFWKQNSIGRFSRLRASGGIHITAWSARWDSLCAGCWWHDRNRIIAGNDASISGTGVELGRPSIASGLWYDWWRCPLWCVPVGTAGMEFRWKPRLPDVAGQWIGEVAGKIRIDRWVIFFGHSQYILFHFMGKLSICRFQS